MDQPAPPLAGDGASGPVAGIPTSMPPRVTAHKLLKRSRTLRLTERPGSTSRELHGLIGRHGAMPSQTCAVPTRCGRLVAALAIALIASSLIARISPAQADPLLPTGDHIFTGLTGGSSPRFTAETGKHPAVNGVFVTWGHEIEGAFGEASYNHARLMLHISTAQGYGAPEQITPRAIAEGYGDGYILTLDEAINR